MPLPAKLWERRLAMKSWQRGNAYARPRAMPSKPPFFALQRYDTCALACLRMVLVHFGKQATEDQLRDAVDMAEGGVDIVELARLARSQGLSAEIQQPDLSGLAALLADEKLAIVYLNRLPLDQEFAIHAVLPIRVTSRFVA